MKLNVSDMCTETQHIIYLLTYNNISHTSTGDTTMLMSDACDVLFATWRGMSRCMRVTCCYMSVHTCDMLLCLSIQQLLAEPLWTVDTQRNQQTITNVVAKRAVGM